MRDCIGFWKRAKIFIEGNGRLVNLSAVVLFLRRVCTNRNSWKNKKWESPGLRFHWKKEKRKNYSKRTPRKRKPCLLQLLKQQVGNKQRKKRLAYLRNMKVAFFKFFFCSLYLSKKSYLVENSFAFLTLKYLMSLL